MWSKETDWKVDVAGLFAGGNVSISVFRYLVRLLREDSSVLLILLPGEKGLVITILEAEWVNRA